MSDPKYLICHKDHPLDPLGFNGGAEMATIYLARFLARSGARVIVAAQLKRPAECIDGVEFWSLGPDWDVRSAIQRASSLGPYYLISAGRAQPLVEAKSDTNCRSRILITHDRSINDTGLGVSIVSRLVDCIICVSNAQREVLMRGGAPGEKLCVVNNGVDLELYKAAGFEQRDPWGLIFAGALIEDKGIHVLIDAYAKLKAKHPKLHLDVYGTAALWGRKEFLNPREIEAKLPGVKFHGNVEPPRLAQAYAEAALCVYPSIWFEPFGLCAADALATGCPVVAFDVGGPRDIVIDQQNGRLLGEISAESLTAAIDDLLSHPAKRQALSQGAIQMRERFDWGKVAAQVGAMCRSAERQRAPSSQEPAQPVTRGRLGFLSTWNQQCGLATYAHYLLTPFEPGSYVVLGEEAPTLPGVVDEPNVERCWRRGSSDFSALVSAVKKHDLKLLHVNCHYRFFPQPAFSNCLQQLRSSGVKAVVHLHNPYTLDDQLGRLVTAADQVIVHTPENRLEVIANGAAAENVAVLTHGVAQAPELNEAGRQDLRAQLGLPLAAKIIVCFGFVQPHKGLEGLIDGVAELNRAGLDCYGYMVGRPLPDDAHGAEYAKQLLAYAKERGAAERIVMLNRFVSDQEVVDYLRAADVVLMNYRSQYYEASGACSLAVGAGAVVAASLAPPLMAFGEAVWHLTSGYPLPLALSILLLNERVRSALKTNARRYSEENNWQRTKEKLLGIYAGLGFEPFAEVPLGASQTGRTAVKEKEQVVERHERQTGRAEVLKVLMHNRPNTFSQPGGDTVVMQQLIARLQTWGVQVTVDLELQEDPAKHDLVHLFNFALPDLTRHFAERAWKAKVPYVVTTLCEDIGAFHNQSLAVSQALLEYVQRGQDRAWWAQNKGSIGQIQPCPPFQNEWSAEHAAALIVNGESEAAVVRRLYPCAKRIVEIKLGFEIGAAAGADDFVRKYGIKDFVFCVGRLESRKNQLMLLKALEDNAWPVVIAGGGFSYQPQYEQAVRSFKRRGPTLVLERLTPEMLSSAYAAAKVHVLASWYELPGLVSLEAAYHGCNVVITENGTARDYFGSHAFYCDPGSESSIYNAVTAAWYAPVPPELRAIVQQYSWEETAHRTFELYKEVAGASPHQSAPDWQQAACWQMPGYAIQNSPEQPAHHSEEGCRRVSNQENKPPPPRSAELEEILDQGELAAIEKRYADAHRMFSEAERKYPEAAPLLRARAAVFLVENNVPEARRYFKRALKIDPQDAKTVCGMGLCDLYEEKTAEAYAWFIESLELNPNHVAAIHGLIQAGYGLKRYDDLERVLRSFLEEHPKDIEMRYCLAGCVYKTGRESEAEEIIEHILSHNPAHGGALELKQYIARQRSNAVELQGQEPQESGVNNQLAEWEEAKRDGKFDEVVAGCREILQSGCLSPEQLEWALLLQAEGLSLKCELKEAEQQFRRVLDSNPQQARAWCGLGAMAAHRKQWEDARAHFERALQFQAEYDVAWAGLGLVNRQKGDNEAAWQCYWRATQANPENMRAVLGMIELGYALGRLGEMEEALRAYLELHPASLEFIYSLAGCLYSQNKLEQAAQEVERIMVFKPDHAQALELRQAIAEKRGAAGRQHEYSAN